MSKNLKHYQALDDLVTNALLTLYCTMSNKGGFWTTKRRNEVLVKCIKPKLKQSQFGTCKNEIKTMLSIGRRATGDLEKKLWDINKLNLTYQSKFSQADELYIMLSGLFEQHQFPSMMANSEKPIEIDTVYISEKDIARVFDESNNQTQALPMTVQTDRLATLVESVESNGRYRVETGLTDEANLTHLLLHKVG